MSDDINSKQKRPSSAKTRVLFAVILIAVVAIASFYRREIYVFAMIECGGLRLNLMATPHVLKVHRELLDEELAEAESEADEVDILKSNLRHQYEWVHTHALQYIKSHRERLAPQMSSELFTVLEQKYGYRAMLAEELLSELPKFSTPELQRLLALAQTGDPDWRQVSALKLMGTHRVSFTEPELRHVGVERAVNSDNMVVRETAVRLLQSLTEPLALDDIQRLIEAEHEEPQIAGLQFLHFSDHESTVQRAKSLFLRGHPETKQLALAILKERDPEFAREAAKQALSSIGTRISAGALLTLRRLGETVPIDQETKIIEALENDILSHRFVGHQTMRRLWIMYELDAHRAIDCAHQMIKSNQLKTLASNFLENANETPPKSGGER